MDSEASSSRRQYFQFEFRDDDVFTKYMIDLRIKNGVAVDPQSCHVQDAHVYCDEDGNPFSAYLTETDVENRKNSYHKLQILEPDDPNTVSSIHSCWLFQSYGGIGAAGYMYNETLMVLRDAIEEFKAIFENLTDNSWEDRKNFEKIRGKMNLLEIVYTPNVVDDFEASTNLIEPVQKLVRSMISSEQRKLPKIQTRDSRKWPMGKLSDKHIEEALEVLGELLNCVSGREEMEEKIVIRCTNKYYSLVPRASESGCLRLLNTAEAIHEEYEFLDSLPKNLRQFSSVDAHYANLSTKLNPMDSDDPFYQILETCVLNTGNVEVVEIYQLDRHGETQRFSAFKHFGNRKLLWHGSPLSNFVRILSQGLIIRGVARSGLFGTGIYFSDMVAKAVPYCRLTPTAEGTFGHLLLCEVALGHMEPVKSRTSTTKRATAPRPGYDSVMGYGITVPDPKDDMEFEDGLVLALGRGIPSKDLDSHVHQIPYNEYIVYDEAQVKMRYLVKFRPMAVAK